MLDRLPVELLQHVLRLAYPVHYDSRTHKERRESLMSLCLVNKRTKDVAQPMLFEVVELFAGGETDYRPTCSLEEGCPLPHLVSALKVCPKGGTWRPRIGLVGPEWTKLADLTVEGGHLSWTELSSIPGLRYLFLTNCDVNRASPLLTFPALRSFSAYLLAVEPGEVDVMLSPRAMPKLSHLAISVMGPTNNGIAEQFFDLLPSQVEVLFPILLVDLSVRPGIGLHLPFFPTCGRLRFFPHNVHEEEFPGAVVGLLVDVADALKSPVEGKLPQVLVFPRFLLDNPRDAYEGPLQKVLDRCEGSGVVVLWDDGREDEPESLLIPQSFINYKRQFQAEEAVEKDADEVA